MHSMKSLDACLHHERLMKIERQPIHDASSSHATWLNHDAPSTIKWMRLNGVDLHQDILFGSSIKDQSSDQIVTTNFRLLILPLVHSVKHSWMLLSIEPFGYLNP